MKTALTLLPASFRGIPFLMNSSSVDAGRKIVTHEFPNSNNRTDEDLGRLNRTYNISATITGSAPFEYDITKQALLAALDKGGLGVFIHPFDGLLSVVAKTYTLVESENALNSATFNIVFSESTRNISPFTLPDQVSEIFTYAELAFAAITAFIALNYRVDKKSTSNVRDSTRKVADVSARFRKGTTQFVSDEEFIDNFGRDLGEYRSRIPLNAIDGTSLSESTTDLFKSADNLPFTPLTALTFYRKFFDYGDDDLTLLQTTSARVERERNRKLINALVQVDALIMSYRNAVSIEFAREDEIQELAGALDTQYLKVIQNTVLSAKVISTLTDIKTRIAAFFRQAEVAAFRITEATTNTIPITVLTYQYYGNTELTAELVDLNAFNDVSFVRGTVEMLSQ